MAQLPSDPAPISIKLIVEQPSAKSKAINGTGSQSRSSGIFNVKATASWGSLLTFEERNKLMGFLLEQKGRVTEFDVPIVTHSENSQLGNATATAAATYEIGTSTLTLNGMIGSLGPMNVIRINGQKSCYFVTSASPESAGVQTVKIAPPLRTQLGIGGVVLTKDVPFNMSITSDSIEAVTQGMSASMSIDLEEEVL